MRYSHICAATDFSTLGDLAVDRATKLAVDQGASLTLLHVLPEPPVPSPLVAHYEIRTDQDKVAKARGEATEALRQRLPDGLDAAKVRLEVRVGDPTEEILACEREHGPDLIVLATNGRRGFSRLIMGSVAERVLRLAQGDVLAVRPRDA